jgi:hypothetical protein
MDPSGNIKADENADNHSERSFKKPSNLDPVRFVSDSVCLRKSMVKAF